MTVIRAPQYGKQPLFFVVGEHNATVDRLVLIDKNIVAGDNPPFFPFINNNTRQTFKRLVAGDQSVFRAADVRKSKRTINSKPSCGHPADRTGMTERPKTHGDVLRKRPDIGAAGAGHLQKGLPFGAVVRQRPDGMDRYRPLCQDRVFPLSRELVGANAFDFHRRKTGRDLRDGPGKKGQGRFKFVAAGNHSTGLYNGPLGIKRVGLRSELDAKMVYLRLKRQEGNQPGRLSDCDDQQAACRRVEGTRVPCLAAPENAAKCGHDRKRGRPAGFVDAEKSIG